MLKVASKTGITCLTVYIIITLTMGLGSSPLVAQDPSNYTKKGSWQETVLASREALMAAEQAAGGGLPLDFGQEDFTVSLWIRTTAKAGPLFMKSSSTSQWEIGSKVLSIYDDDGQTNLLYLVRVPDRDRKLEEGQQTDERSVRQIAIALGYPGEINLSDGEWHQVAVSTTNERYTFYADGREIRSLTYLNFRKLTPDNPDHSLFAGGRGAKFFREESPGLTGAVDELQVFAGVLTEDEIAALYKDPGSVKDGLQGWWSFNGDVKDAVGYAGEGEVTNGTFVDGKFGQAISFDGKGDAKIPAMPGKGARDAIWRQARRDFADDEAQQQMQWEAEDGIWALDWPAGDYTELARRYAKATPDILASAKKASDLAKKVKKAKDLKKVRDVYYSARESYGHVTLTKEKVDFMLKEIDYLQDQHTADDGKWNSYKKSTNDITKRFKTAKASLESGKKSALKQLADLYEETLTLHDALPHRLPSGPQGPVPKFGAVYDKLKYTLDWDWRWRVSKDADVVVQFDEGPYKFVFWRGCSYIPGWATERDGPWFVNEFFERRGWLGGGDSMMEPMSDKQCRYSHVRVVENSDARVVVHWRYTPCDLNYNVGYIDPETKWGDWADEYWTIYPDGIAMRSATLFSSGPNEDWIEYHESIFINQPGTMPSDNVPQAAVTLANFDGETHTYSWGPQFPEAFDKPEKPNIQLVNFFTKYKHFSIVTPEEVTVSAYPKDSRFDDTEYYNTWDAWPVSQDWSDARKATNFNKVSHSNLTHIHWKPYVETPAKRTWLMMTGMTNKGAGELAPLGKSWEYSPDLKLTGKGFTSDGYNKPERAYHLACEKTGQPGTLSFDLAASKDSPVANLALVVDEWGDAGASLSINGKDVPQGKDFRIGYRQNYLADDLIVFIKVSSTEKLSVSLVPKQ